MKKINRFDFEQQLMDCWGVVNDIETLYSGIGDIGMTEDQIMNALLGMQELYSIKFDLMFRSFEQLAKDGQIDGIK